MQACGIALANTAAMSRALFPQLAVILALLGTSSFARATILWKGDFSTGDLSQWQSPTSPTGSSSCGCASYDTSHITLLSESGSPAQYCQFTLAPGETAYNCNHCPPVDMDHRSELTHQGDGSGPSGLLVEGDDIWYRVEYFFPASWSVTDGQGGGSVATQWHHQALADGSENGSPRLLLVAFTDTFELIGAASYESQDDWTGFSVALPKGRWFVMSYHVVFSADPAKGLFEAWMDGAPIASVHTNTIFQEQVGGESFGSYLKVGEYPRPAATPTLVTSLRNVFSATTQADVAIPAADAGSSPVDGGTPPSMDAGPPLATEGGPPASSLDAGPMTPANDGDVLPEAAGATGCGVCPSRRPWEVATCEGLGLVVAFIAGIRRARRPRGRLPL